MNLDLQETTSPFHPGEQQAQERMGVRDKLEKIGRKHIRDHLPDQHRAFYATLPFVLLGTVDEHGRPWASLVAGRPGFMSSPDPRRLEIASQPLFGDPLNGTLTPGGEVGLLGIQPETRRRNRMTGRVNAAGRDGISVEVGQTFGNCPKYVQVRAVDVQPGIDTPQAERPTTVSDHFDADVRALIERADTLFIATAYLEGPETPARGADVSHRGGKPGFVRVDDDRTFVLPDFSGNLHFNTVGNILSNPKAGFLFVDFDSGDLVYMTGEAEIVWDGEDIDAFAGAERLIRFRAEKVIRVEGSLPLRFNFGEYSPNLERTGSWRQTAGTA
jgi:predicted pyridoxine 5'-phosphate oxidase superfamily flavin-nucleotide-binding protein